MKKLIFFILSFAFCLLHPGCKKGPGEGGQAVIKGKVWVRKHDPAYSAVVDSYWGADDDVYIVFGDETSYGDHVKTDYEGDFEFPYLRKGKYKVYVYSDDSVKIVGPPKNPDAGQVPIVMEVEVTERKQTIDVGTITVLH